MTEKEIQHTKKQAATIRHYESRDRLLIDRINRILNKYA